MKKALALLAALCMLLTALPVLAEEDASGTWHIVMLGMTVGTLDLNADGTCSLITSDEKEEAPVEGTWTLDGEKITVDANGSTLPLTYDGTNLLFDIEGLAALGVDTSSLGEGLDPSMLSSLIQISREPGKITAAEFSAYQADGTLVPEISGYERVAFDAADLRRVRKVICLAGGRDKVPALIAAAKAGYYNMLVTDSVTAEAIYTTIRS